MNKVLCGILVILQNYVLYLCIYIVLWGAHLTINNLESWFLTYRLENLKILNQI